MHFCHKPKIVDISSFFIKGKLIGKLVPSRENYDFNIPASGSITGPISVSISDYKEVNSAEWNFGDEIIVKGLTASHKYKKGGDYEVSVEIAFFGGIILKGKKKITILETRAVGEDEIIDGIMASQ